MLFKLHSQDTVSCNLLFAENELELKALNAECDGLTLHVSPEGR